MTNSDLSLINSQSLRTRKLLEKLLVSLLKAELILEMSLSFDQTSALSKERSEVEHVF